MNDMSVVAQKLESEQLIFREYPGKSDMWKQFALVVDEHKNDLEF